MALSTSAATADRRAALEHKIETLHRVITGVAVALILVLLVMGTGFLPYVLIRWGFVH